MPGSIGPLEIALVLLIALVVFGPKRLPELGKGLGRGMRDFKRAVTGDDDEERQREEEERAQQAQIAAAAVVTPPSGATAAPAPPVVSEPVPVVDVTPPADGPVVR
jgi:sec-independent protein translocase protein TatA